VKTVRTQRPDAELDVDHGRNPNRDRLKSFRHSRNVSAPQQWDRAAGE
jgi:hypothetical protein